MFGVAEDREVGAMDIGGLWDKCIVILKIEALPLRDVD